MEKEFGKLSRQQLREIYAHYHGVKVERAEFSVLFKQRDVRVKQMLDLVGSWGKFYEFTDAIIALLFFDVIGLLSHLKLALRCEDQMQGLLDFIDGDHEFEPPSVEEEAAGVVLYMALMGNQQASDSFGFSMSELVNIVAESDDPLEPAIFKAVVIDRGVVQAEPIARKIAYAQMINDNAFMDKLAKAITQTKPVRPKVELDDTRFLIKLLDDTIGLDNISNKDVDELIADDLQAIPGHNSYDRISKLLTEFRNMYRK